MQRPGASRPRTFRYEEEMSWCRDFVLMEAAKRTRLTGVGVDAPTMEGGGTYPVAPLPAAVCVFGEEVGG